MPIDLNALPDAQTIAQALQMGEGPQIEFKEAISDSMALSRLISAFANATGGLIFVGIREHPTKVVGCDYIKLGRVFDRTVEIISPADVATLDRVQLDDRDVGVIRVRRANQIVTSAAGVFVRDGHRVLPMDAPKIEERLTPVAPALVNHQLAEGLVLLSQTVEGLRSELAYSRTIRGQATSIVISFVVGCITGVIGNLLFQALFARKS